MLEIVQAGQSGKTSLLFDMHRLRKRVFKDRMKWDVSITPGGLEIDDFDLPEAIYLLVLDEKSHEVVGSWRLLPTTGPIMINKIWPKFLESIDIPSNPLVWEASRFAVECPLHNSGDENLKIVSETMQEMLFGLAALSLISDIKRIYTMYDMRIARLLKRLDCAPDIVSKRLSIEGNTCEVGCFIGGQSMIDRLEKTTRIKRPIITTNMLPPALCKDTQPSDIPHLGLSKNHAIEMPL